MGHRENWPSVWGCHNYSAVFSSFSVLPSCSSASPAAAVGWRIKKHFSSLWNKSVKGKFHVARLMKRQTWHTSSALASPFSAGVSPFSASGSSFLSSGLAFTSFAFLVLAGAYNIKNKATRHEMHRQMDVIENKNSVFYMKALTRFPHLPFLLQAVVLLSLLSVTNTDL